MAASSSASAPATRSNSVGASQGLTTTYPSQIAIASASSSSSPTPSTNSGSARIRSANLPVAPNSYATFRQPSHHITHQQLQQSAATSRQMYHHQSPQSAILQHHQSKERFFAELTNCIIAFLTPIIPTEEEYRIKEATRRQLERLVAKVSPGAKLLAFGSMANGFALKNSDMDLCCLIAKNSMDGQDENETPPEFNASHLVEELGKVLRQDTDYNVMPLPKARIPIIKISRSPTSDRPYEISCDIGFENRLALENTRLLLSYAMVDPPRLRTLVLFLKVWTKRRKLNSPFTGTLSSYGYTLMMIFFLTHIKRPSVLPNLQRVAPNASSTTKKQHSNLNGHNTYFYDDVATLRKEWSSMNTENVGELLLDFFKYFSKEFGYSRDVISIRTETGFLQKDSTNWSSELCIEDPFQSGYNVARTVTKDGLYTIRGEFMRATRILTTRNDRVSAALGELCEEREDGLTRAPESNNRQKYQNGHAFSGMFPPNGNFDLRGFGGSFAFEEMARGLAQAQHGGSVMAYPPTTAMLAPLSQSVGLNPRQTLMRAGLRYDTPRRGQSVAVGMPGVNGSTTNMSKVSANDIQQSPIQTKSRIPSSARSEDGGPSSYERRKSKRWNNGYDSQIGSIPNGSPNGIGSIGNASARTSPRLDHSVPQGLLHPNSALNGSGINEAFAFGSEISFGSQRFQLHPQTSSKRHSSVFDEDSSNSLAVHDEEGFGIDDDERASISDATLDDLARVSAIESSMGGDFQPSDGEPIEGDVSCGGHESDEVAEGTNSTSTNASLVKPARLVAGSEPVMRVADPNQLELNAVGKEHDVRSWAASQREQLVDRQRSST